MASWLRNVRELVVLYFAAGFSFAPWGLVYALAGRPSPILAATLFVCGALTALVVWNRLELYLRARRIAANMSGSARVVVMRTRGTLVTSGFITMRIVRDVHPGPASSHGEVLEPVAAVRPTRQRAFVSVVS
jgi:hypothetical protein